MGTAGPLLLLSICLVIFLVGVAGRWLDGSDEGARIVRIMSLAPLITPQAVHAQDTLVEETVSADLSEAPQVDVAATPIPELESQAVEAALSVPLTVEDGDQASAFASPAELAAPLVLN